VRLVEQVVELEDVVERVVCRHAFVGGGGQLDAVEIGDLEGGPLREPPVRARSTARAIARG